jgi:hypothetical protein
MFSRHARESSAATRRTPASVRLAGWPKSKIGTCHGRLRREAATRIAESLRVELQRCKKREYMRRWRSDPANAAQEAAARRREYYDRKCRRAAAETIAEAHNPAEPVCGMCGRKAPVCEIERFVILADKHGTFAPVRVPYCGVC